MIEIKCSEEQKTHILTGWKTKGICPIYGNCPNTDDCEECREKNIKWIITDEAEPEAVESELVGCYEPPRVNVAIENVTINVNFKEDK